MTDPDRGIKWRNLGFLLFMLAGIISSPRAQAQTVAGDTVTITINQLEALFLKNNLQLIAQKELLRIQSQLYSLRAELVNLQVGIDTTQTHIKLMARLSPNSYLVPRYNYALTGKETLAKVPYQQLLDSAFVNRFDLKYAQATLNYNTLNLQLQKSLAVPDVTFSLAYDKQVSYIKNFTSVGVGVPIPVFNRNQGVIKQARIAIAQSNVAVLSSQQRVESDVSINYKVARTYENTYNTFDPDFRASFTHLIQEVSRNYAKKNISLLSFLDFYDSYKVNSVLLNNVEMSRVTSLEQLNFVTGTSFFNQQ